MYWLGTDKGNREWKNPYNEGVLITASSLGRGSLESLTFNGTSVFSTDSYPDSWITFEFVDINIQPTHYTLGCTESYDSPRSWKLEGLAEGKEWVTISEQTNDCSLGDMSRSHTWAVQTDRFFHTFRILQIGETSGRTHFLKCCGFELYGIVKMKQKA